MDAYHLAAAIMVRAEDPNANLAVLSKLLNSALAPVYVWAAPEATADDRRYLDIAGFPDESHIEAWACGFKWWRTHTDHIPAKCAVRDIEITRDSLTGE